MKKVTLYVSRCKSDMTVGNSAPCEDCHRKMLKFGIKRIVYTGDDKLISVKPDEYESYGKSIGKKYLENDFKRISRN